MLNFREFQISVVEILFLLVDDFCDWDLRQYCKSAVNRQPDYRRGGTCRTELWWSCHQYSKNMNFQKNVIVSSSENLTSIFAKIFEQTEICHKRIDDPSVYAIMLDHIVMMSLFLATGEVSVESQSLMRVECVKCLYFLGSWFWCREGGSVK